MYVYIVSGGYEKTMLHEEEQEEEKTEREEFYIPAPIAEQAEKIEESKEYTLIYIDPWTMCATMHHITVLEKDITHYAQYENTLYLRYIEKGKRKAQAQYFHNGSSILLYKGFLPCVPPEVINKQIDDNMCQIRNAGISVSDFMIDVYKHYRGDGYTPEINTLQF